MKNNIPKKTIRIPLDVSVDVSDYLEIIHESVFQNLRDKKQLGFVGKILPGGLHSRFEHSLGTLHLTQKATRHFGFDNDKAKLLELLALLHDIGHGPYSHQVEPLITGDDHDKRGLRIVSGERFKEEIGKLVDHERFVALFSGQNPMSKIVYDRNLGTDKLDYLFRDAYHIGLRTWPDTSLITSYLIYDNGILGVEEKLEKAVMELQRHYVYMHAYAYLRKQSVINQRIVQRAVEEVLKVAPPDIDLMSFNDSCLEAELINTSSQLAKDLHKRLKFRETLKTAVVFKIQGYGKGERIAKKPITVFELSEEDMEKFGKKYRDVKDVSILEDSIAEHLGIKQGELLVATMPFAERIVPKDIPLYSSNTDKWSSLFEKYPYHETGLNHEYKAVFAIRIVTTEERRSYVCDRAKEIKAMILDKIK